jgi:mRNA-degrading endonuclease RelE of RelBE toxin-antitoxin system
MNRIAKFLRRLTPRERKVIADVIARVLARDFSELDVKKLKGMKNIFRVRHGTIRIIFLKNHTKINILSIERRSDTTY